MVSTPPRHVESSVISITMVHVDGFGAGRLFSVLTDPDTVFDNKTINTCILRVYLFWSGSGHPASHCISGVLIKFLGD